ncbi:MAG: hypothetical protein U1F15_14820 [Burkholderiales bacterium]
MNVAPGLAATAVARFAITLATMVAALPASAQQPTSAQAGAIRQACRSDYPAVCAGVPTGGQAALACLQQNAASTSPACQQALRAVGGASAAAPAAAPRAASAMPAAATQPAAETWPHTVTGDGGTATVYTPQVISWPEHRTLNTRIALGLTPNGARAPILGVIAVAFATQTELAERTVVLTEPRLTSSRFPSVDAAQAAQFDARIRAVLANLPAKRVPLATITMSLAKQAEAPAAPPLDNTPPRIFVSARPASLVVFDGEPVTAPIAGTTLSFAVNTNWDVFVDSGTKTWYLINNGGWLAAPDAKGPWLPAGALPPSFAALPDDRNFADVKKQVPGRAYTAQSAPVVFVSTAPAAIIVTGGPPQYVAIAGTSLSYVANTDAALFRDAGGRYYYLVSGRWFSAASLDGPWTFATASLPPDFARIPANGPRGFVLVSVPGTPQAQEALLEAQIPQQATLSKGSAKVDVVYAGPPQFAPIPGTPMSYAVNTSFNVIQTADGYFSCYQGAWFAAPAPAGPWTLTPTVPAVIYTIPPSSPLYPCTFVRVYASSPDTVTYGYTSGYTMSYVSAGVVVYGTGYYYPPYLYPAPIPIYYPYPYSYAGATYYNAATGAWAQGGAIYGPYGGAAKAGYAYNPNTGAYAQGGAIYGPNGGAGAFSAYNPSTGSYAHGSAVYGPDGAGGNASWYNANTGRSGSTQQNSNAYGRWGSSTISGPNQTVHTQSQSNAQGSAGSFSSSSGAKGAGVSGAGGNSAGAVKTASGDVYAGADGNVYKKTDSGWQKYDNGSWNSVDKPTTTQRGTASTTGAPGATERPAGGATPAAANRGDYASSRSQGFSQLEQDRTARMQGGARQQQFESMRGGGGGFSGRGGGGFRR